MLPQQKGCVNNKTKIYRRYLAIVRNEIIQRKPIMCNDKVDTVVWLSLIYL